MQRKYLANYLINKHRRILNSQKYIFSKAHPFYNIIFAIKSARPATAIPIANAKKSTYFPSTHHLGCVTIYLRNIHDFGLTLFNKITITRSSMIA